MISLVNIKQFIGNGLFLLLIMVIILDPSNTILHMKDKFFVLLVGFCMLVYKPDFKYLIHISLIFSSVLSSFVFAEMQGNHIDMDKFVAVLKAFSPLVLLLWIKNFDVIKLSIFPSFMACVMIFVMYFIAVSSEELEYAMYLFFVKHDEFVMMGRRYFFGIQFFGLYLKSFVDLMFTLFLVFFYTFNSQRTRNKIFFAALMVVFSLTFFISNTRSTMLLPIVMFCFVWYASVMKRSKMKYYVYPVLVLLTVLFLAFVFVLATEKGEMSNAIKYSHLSSYIKLFTENPEYILLGQGPATMFYSEGFRRMTMETEWTYIELIRVYGVFSLLILSVVFFPVYRLWRFAKKDTFSFGIWGTYIIYLFIAGTNPLILSSTGMIMILAIYSYLEQAKLRFPEWNETKL